MTSYQDLFTHGEGFESFVSRGLPVEIEAVRAIQQTLAEPDALGASTRQRLHAIQGRFHLLVVGEMWCPDCQINVTAMDELHRLQPTVDLAIISKGRAENTLKARLGLERVSIPFVLVLDDAFQPVGRFVEQPHAVASGGDAVKADYRAGRFLDSTVQDLLDIIEAVSPSA